MLSPSSWLLPGFFVLGTCEMVLPMLSERAARTTWHRHHIAERYGLLTIIVLGEAILAAVLAIESTAGEAGAGLGLAAGGLTVSSILASGTLPVFAGGVLAVFAMWALYFERPQHDLLTDLRTAFVWGYGHLVIYGAAAAVGAGLAVAVDHATHHADIDATTAGAALAVPVAVYLLSVWFLLHRPRGGLAAHSTLLGVVAVLATPFTPQPVLATGLVLLLLVVLRLALGARAHKAVPEAAGQVEPAQVVQPVSPKAR